ncbi:cysteine desulfurase [Azospirillum thiophilum]|uniref:Cysteine desulfurase n=1 Tax=Azospirillum thiophilum TaxID=528244 RepID=A0AAC8VZU6_9PROT|nr:cysteine desulfurase family protein [Azospirillum thiophilum]ALG72335.1 cysteine desulfurase [Azospirillum thiophilum]KJR61299.1 cysteine desulfurase [Azospirillum thiophilum]
MIYLDHLASTPLDPLVLEAMLPWMRPEAAGNPHAAHRAGWRAADAVEEARAEVAALVGARPGEVVFTSGATEANALALLGGVPPEGGCIVSAVEHASELACLPELRRRGHPVAVLPVDGTGRVDPAELERHLSSLGKPALVSVMAANNEVGTIQPLAELAAVAACHGATIHSDAVQALGTLALDMPALGLHGLSLSGHKLYGPMGIGALVVRPPFRPVPASAGGSAGGGQQRGLRGGTLPTPLCVGLGIACRLARERREEDARRIAGLRDRLWDRLHDLLGDRLPGLRRNGAADGLAGCLNVTIPGIDAADRLLDLPELAASTGSACHSAAGEPSHVLLALGLPAADAHASLRFGLGRGTTAEEVDAAAALLAAALSGRGPAGPLRTAGARRP